jgi:hypothetical protein
MSVVYAILDTSERNSRSLTLKDDTNEHDFPGEAGPHQGAWCAA